MIALIDTNIILDALMNREPWVSTAQAILRAAVMEKFMGCIIASQTTDIFYLLCRQGAQEITVKNIIQKLVESIYVLDVTFYDVQNALASTMLDYEDGLLAYCALRHNANYIITRNELDFIQSPVTAISPLAFLKNYSNSNS